MINPNPPGKRKAFTIQFSESQFSPAVQFDPREDVQHIIDTFGLIVPRPLIYIIGGAGDMSHEDVQRTRAIIEAGVAAFAHEHNITVIDGGTESGVMQMSGEARRKHNYKYPLIGVSPMHKVSYPGWVSPERDAMLDAGHSHFVLVDTEDFGGESQTLVDLARRIRGDRPALGILINGGRIAEKEVYLATAKDEPRIPILILDGSGRAANDIGAALKTGRTSKEIIRAIVKGGDIRMISITDGPQAMYDKLSTYLLGDDKRHAR